MSEPLGSFCIEFGTDRNAIDAAVYGSALSNTVVVFEECASALEPGSRVRLRVEAEKPGSFLNEVSIEALLPTVGAISLLITPENAKVAFETVSKLVKGVGKVFEYFKQTKDKEPKRITQLGDGNVLVEANNSAPVTINQTFLNVAQDNPRVREAVGEIFNAMERDELISQFRYLDAKKKPLFSVGRSEFPALAKIAPEPVDTKTRKTIRNRAVLSIIRPSFDEKKRFDFIWAGNPITAQVDDESFWESIKRGERFAMGDRLVAALEVSQRFNETGGVWENVGYKVLAVLEHRERFKQPSLLASLPAPAVDVITADARKVKQLPKRTSSGAKTKMKKPRRKNK